MDFMTVFGLLMGGATMFFVMAEGNILNMIINPLAFILVFGGTFSATLISYPWDIVRRIIPSLKTMFVKTGNGSEHREDLIEQITRLAEKARRQNIESLQEDVASINDGFLAYGIQMVLDGLEHEVVKDNLEKEILFTQRSRRKVSDAFRTMATLAPIFGLLGTLIGVVQVLRNLSDPTSMGEAMAIAITTTFYGIFAANFLFLPAAIKLNENNEDEVMNWQIAAEGILSIQQGDLPLIVRKKLNAFLLKSLGREGGTRKD